jgi:hypothetical protein
MLWALISLEYQATVRRDAQTAAGDRSGASVKGQKFAML